MSIDFLQVSGNRSSLRAPDSTVQSGLTSLTAGVALANGGLDVTQSGLQTYGVYPPGGQFSFDLSGNGVTIPVEASVILISASAGRTGTIMGAPPVRKTGVTVKLVNRSSFNHTFAVGGTSAVQDGSSVFLRSYSATEFVWVEPDARWTAINTR